MKRYWYKFRVKYGKALDTGKNKKVSEEYLVDAESFTETEKRATKAATELIGTRDFDITAISREPITEILKEDEKEGNHWYKTVVSLLTTDHLRQCSFDKGSRPHATSAHEQQCDRVENQIHSRDQGSWCSWL